MTLTASLHRFLSRPPRLFLWRRDGIRPGTQGSGPSFLVVSRAVCRFKSFGEVEGQNPGQRRAALNLKIRSWAPFPDAQHVSVAAGGRHMVWAWSQHEAEQILSASGQRVGRAVPVPETLFQNPLADGVRLISCLDGVEGQVWSNGALTESRWWAEPPSQSDWIGFQRAAGLKPDRMSPNVPRSAQPRWQERPWGGGQATITSLLRRMEPVEWAVAIGVIFLAPLIFLGAESLHIDANLRAVDQHIAELERNAGPILDARSQALAAAERIRQLTALDPYPPQVEVMAKVASALPDDGSHLVDWTYQNGELTFAVTKPAGQIDSTSYVRRFIDAGFTDVSIDPGNPTQLKVNLKVPPKR